MFYVAMLRDLKIHKRFCLLALAKSQSIKKPNASACVYTHMIWPYLIICKVFKKVILKLATMAGSKMPICWAHDQ